MISQINKECIRILQCTLFGICILIEPNNTVVFSLCESKKVLYSRPLENTYFEAVVRIRRPPPRLPRAFLWGTMQMRGEDSDSSGALHSVSGARTAPGSRVSRPMRFSTGRFWRMQIEHVRMLFQIMGTSREPHDNCTRVYFQRVRFSADLFQQFSA